MITCFAHLGPNAYWRSLLWSPAQHQGQIIISVDQCPFSGSVSFLLSLLRVMMLSPFPDLELWESPPLLSHGPPLPNTSLNWQCHFQSLHHLCLLLFLHCLLAGWLVWLPASETSELLGSATQTPVLAPRAWSLSSELSSMGAQEDMAVTDTPDFVGDRCHIHLWPRVCSTFKSKGCITHSMFFLKTYFYLVPSLLCICAFRREWT